MLYKKKHILFYIFPVIAGAVGGSNRSAVNLKQCSRRDLNYRGEYGLVFVSMLVKLVKQYHLRLLGLGAATDFRLLGLGAAT